jgi:hypothetical protein
MGKRYDCGAGTLNDLTRFKRNDRGVRQCKSIQLFPFVLNWPAKLRGLRPNILSRESVNGPARATSLLVQITI